MAFGQTDLSIVINAQDKASGTFGKVGGSLGKLAKVGAVGVAALGVAAAGATVAAVKMAQGYQAAMKEVESLGVPADQMKVLEQGVLDLSRRLGVDATEATGALYQAISAGVPPENALAFLETASKAAIAGVTDAETAVDGISSVVNAFASQNLSATQAADLMFATVKAGKTNFEELSSSIANVAPLANATGVEFAEVSAALATMTASGTATTVATTQIRSAIQSLTKPSEELTAIFEAAGFASGEAAVKQVGFAGAADIVSKATGGSVAEMTKLLGSIEGVQGVLGVTGAQADAFGKNMEGMRNSAGAADTAFGTMSESFEFQMNRVRESFKSGLIQVGLQILPVITPIVSAIAEKLPAAFNLVVPFIMQFVEGIKGLVENVQSLLAPMDLFTGGLSNNVPIFETVQSLFTAIGETMGRLQEPLQALVAALLEGLSPILRILGEEVLPLLLSIWNDLIAQFQEKLLPLVEEVVIALTEALKPAIKIISTVVTFLLKNVLIPWYEFIKAYIIPIVITVARVLMTTLRDAFKFIAALLKGDFAGAWTAIQTLVSNVINGVIALFGQMVSAVTGAVSTIIGAVRNMATEIKNAVKDIPVLGGVVGGLGGMLGFQHGGSFMVGGSGGADSQTVAFRASPGERVTVTPPGRAAAGGGVSQTIVVQGSLVTERQLADLAVEAMRDATRLNDGVLNVDAVVA